jgi:outer membrane protein insertion porin family
MMFCLAVTIQAQGLLRNPAREIEVKSIRIEGNTSIDASLIRRYLDIDTGQSYLPPVLSQRLQSSARSLHKQNWFSDIRLEQEPGEAANELNLVVVVVELPTLASVEIEGNDKLKKDDIQAKLELWEGQVYSSSALERAKMRILDLYREKGYLLAKVTVEEVEEPGIPRRKVTFNIEEGKKVAIRYITFEGNDHVADKKLRKVFPVKEDRWWRSGDFDEEEYRLGQDSLLIYYRTLGYLDAQIRGDTVGYTEDKRHLDVRLKIFEGKRYRFQAAQFVHNDIVPTRALQSQVLFDSGEVFDKSKYEMMKYQILSLYREEGHLFADIRDRFDYQDTLVTVRFDIQENGIAHINLVHLLGNTKTKDKVVRREVKLFPGDIFRQSLLMRSQRDIMQLAFFDMVEPDIQKSQEGDASDVDLVFKITEKEAGTGQFSAGAAYSARDRLVGTLGLQIPNFLGNGQRADLSLEWGANKSLASVGFTEPWFLDTPTLVGASVFYSQQRAYSQYENDYTRYGTRLNLGRRLTWPDDYFTIRGNYNFTYNDNGQGSDRSLLVVPSGLESSVGITLTRDDKNLPFFPSDGSKYSLTVNKVGGALAGDFDYSQVETKVNWWFPTVGKLVLGMETEFGILFGDQIQSYALYQMGGMLGYQGKLRGYSAGSVGGGRIARSFFSFVTELTYPVVENTFYVLGFFDAGNAFGRLQKYDPAAGFPYYNPVPKGSAPDPWEEIDFSDLRRDFGMGFRLVRPMVAPFGMGFDFGWPLDDTEDYQGRRIKRSGNSPEVQFVIEQGF